MRFIYRSIFFAAFFLMACRIGHASLVLPVNVGDLVKRSDVAFTGICTEAKAHMIFPESVPQGLLITSYTFDIIPDGALKGDLPKTFTFDQWGASVEESRLFGLPYPIGIPKYEVGKTYTLFLTAKTGVGVRAPVSLGHGNFSTVETPDGRTAVVNEYGNKSLFVGLPATKSMSKALSASGISEARLPSGPMDYETFRKLIMNLQRGE